MRINLSETHIGFLVNVLKRYQNKKNILMCEFEASEEIRDKLNDALEKEGEQ